MKKFFAIYRVPVATMEEWKKNTPPEEMKAQGEKLGKDMQEWMAKHKGAFVGEGWPLGKNQTVSKDGVKQNTNDLNYACIIQAESPEAAAAMFADNPHFMIPTSTIDIMEIPHMGM